MKIQRAFKTELAPNDRQRTALVRHAGAARFAYNWGLRQKVDARKAGEKTPTAIDLHRRLNTLKASDYPWMYEVSKCAPQEALRNLDRAYANFFRRCKTKRGKPGFPRRKTRKRGIGGFALTGAIRVCCSAIQLPRLGQLRLKERGYLPETGWRILRATLSERAGRWFVSLQVEQDVPDPKPKDRNILGIDVGISRLAVLSDGTVFENPRALATARWRLRMLDKRLHRRKRGGQNRKRVARALARQHYRVACLRQDAHHKATSKITKQASVVGVESLNVAGMVKNHRLARAVSDASLAEFHRQLDYKMAWAGGEVVRADRWFPSSKTCSACGLIKEDLTLNDREFKCECGFIVDRDLNAAINLQRMAASSAVTAYCPGSSGQDVSPGETAGWVGTKHHRSLGLGG